MNDIRRKQWLDALKDFNNADVSMQQNICELHFTRNDFTASRKLKPNAYPTVFPNRYIAKTISFYSFIILDQKLFYLSSPENDEGISVGSASPRSDCTETVNELTAIEISFNAERKE